MAHRHRGGRLVDPLLDGLERTVERPAPGLSVAQPRRGYRYGVEVYLLADFALRAGPRRVVEIGTGSGIVALLLAAAGVEVVAVEREPRWVALARENVARSGLEGRVRVVEADAREWAGEDADLVVSNPPWFDPAAGPASPDPWRAASRTATHGSPEALVARGLGWAPAVCVVGPRVPAVGVPVRRGRSGRLVLAELRAVGEPGLEEALALEPAYARWGMRPAERAAAGW